MAIGLNFHHEIERRRQAQRRDPLKLSFFFLGGLLVLMAGFYFYEAERVGGVLQGVERQKFELSRLETRALQASKLDEEFQKKARLSGVLVERMEERFYWAPVLERLARLVPGEMQLTRISGETHGEEKRCQLNVEGVVGGANPREVAERFRAEVKNGAGKLYREVQADFRALEEAAEAQEGRHPVMFQIQVQFVAGRELPKPPPPRVKKVRP
jgi:Tfp pilus assembly protein PilN